MAHRIIFGNVNANGSKHNGEGFEVLHDQPNSGLYDVVFAEHFSELPTVVTLQNFPEWNAIDNSGGFTTDNTTLVAVTTSVARVKTGGQTGLANDRNFCFIAIGK